MKFQKYLKENEAPIKPEELENISKDDLIELINDLDEDEVQEIADILIEYLEDNYDFDDEDEDEDEEMDESESSITIKNPKDLMKAIDAEQSINDRTFKPKIMSRELRMIKNSLQKDTFSTFGDKSLHKAALSFLKRHKVEIEDELFEDEINEKKYFAKKASQVKREKKKNKSDKRKAAKERKKWYKKNKAKVKRAQKKYNRKVKVGSHKVRSHR